MRRSGVRFISPAPIQIRVCCYESNRKPFFIGSQVMLDVMHFGEFSISQKKPSVLGWVEPLSGHAFWVMFKAGGFETQWKCILRRVN